MALKLVNKKAILAGAGPVGLPHFVGLGFSEVDLVKYTTLGVSFSVSDFGVHVSGNGHQYDQPLSKLSKQLLLSGTMGPASKKALHDHLLHHLNQIIKTQIDAEGTDVDLAVKHLMGASPDPVAVVVDKGEGDSTVVATVETLPGTFTATGEATIITLPKKPASEVMEEKIADHIVATINSPAPKLGGTPTKKSLLDADDLYMDVAGTSSTSVYHVVAIGKDLKVAVRRAKTKLSIRVEGEVDNYASALASVGMKTTQLPDGKTYASAHYGLDSMPLAVKTVGAVLASIGLDAFSKVGSAHKVVEAV